MHQILAILESEYYYAHLMDEVSEERNGKIK